ncbi:MAG TPA: glycoside hydrolase family 15 protein [Tangfeifania sp.]|nr:glycoside hydrolase family 15 protein [Tangfeifania sp.]
MTYKIRDLGVISDRRSGAVIARNGDVCWYCPGQFDSPSLFASLLDSEKGGVWSLNLQGGYVSKRQYIENSSVLETRFQSENDAFTLTDWMPLNDNFSGICRMISASAKAIKNTLIPAPGYGQEEIKISKINDTTFNINDTYFLMISHPAKVEEEKIIFEIPANEEGWAVLADKEMKISGNETLNSSLQNTLKNWEELSSGFSYEGPYKKEMLDSLRAIRQVTHEESGGIIAALTTSLPEVPGGERNYDYRYVWLRDASMIVSALTRAKTNGKDEKRFLDFICSARGNLKDYSSTPFVTVTKKAAPPESYLNFEGYMNSKPVRVGNNANEQLQLDAGSNILLAAKLIYGNTNTRDHWQVVEEIADFLSTNWQQDDYGIWEEDIARQFTSSKVIMAVALEFISEHSDDESQKKRWLEAAKTIRNFVKNNCITNSGSYAVFAGSDEVDITATLFPEWDYCPADTPEMIQTVEELEKNFSKNDLVYRNLLLFDEKKEGAFLAASFWMAQYWIMRKDIQKSKKYIEAALRYQNDLGLFAEEADPDSDAMLGNIPQSFVHASCIGAIIDFNNAFGTDAEN